MKKAFSILIALVVYTLSFAQAGSADEPEQPSKASWAYEAYRGKITRPPYGLEKILGMIKKISTDKTIGGDDEDNSVLSPQNYSSLSLREKFTYNMIHGESYSQNCDAGLATVDEEKKIFAELPGPFGDEHWSDRQKKFFRDNHDSAVALMTASIGRTHRIGINFKQVIVEINATEMIPLLISTYNIDKKDHDILTMLMLLMLNNKYQPFMVSASYKKLYADKDSRWNSCLNFNTANEALIIERATDFYNGLPKKS